MSASSMAHAEDGVTLRGIAAIFRAHLPAFLVTVLLVVLAGVWLASRMTLQYRAESVLKINAPVSETSEAREAQSEGISATGDIVAELELLRSPRLLQRVIDRLALRKDPELTENLPPIGNQPTTGVSGEQDGVIDAPLVERILKKLRIAQLPASPVIRISYKSRSANQAARVVNTLVDEYRKAKRQLRSARLGKSREYYERQVQALRSDVQAAESAVEKYKNAHRLVDDVGLSMLTNQIASLSSQLIAATEARREAEDRWRKTQRQLRQADGTDGDGPLLDSPLLNSYREQEMRLRQEMRELRNEYGPSHPVMIKAAGKIEEVRRNIRAELDRLAGAVEQDLSVARQREKGLRRTIAGLRQQVLKARNASVGLRALEREAESSRRVLEAFLVRNKQFGVTGHAPSNDFQVISPAYAPFRPAFPRPGQVIVLASVAALTLGVFMVFLAEQINPKLGADMVRRKSADAAPDGAVGASGNGARGEGAAAPLAAANDAGASTMSSSPSAARPLNILARLRDSRRHAVSVQQLKGDGEPLLMKAMAYLDQQLEQGRESRAGQVVIVSGDNNRQDRLSVTASLALLRARRKRPVIVIDLLPDDDSRFREVFDAPANGRGIAEIIRERLSVYQALRPASVPGVDVLSGGRFRTPKERVDAAGYLKAIVTRLQDRYDLVLVVTDREDGTLSALADAMVEVLEEPRGGAPKTSPAAEPSPVRPGQLRANVWIRREQNGKGDDAGKWTGGPFGGAMSRRQSGRPGNASSG